MWATLRCAGFGNAYGQARQHAGAPMSDEEPPWWKWAGIPRLRRSAGEISRREWRDIAWGVLLGSGILALGLLLLAGILWLVRS